MAGKIGTNGHGGEELKRYILPAQEVVRVGGQEMTLEQCVDLFCEQDKCSGSNAYKALWTLTRGPELLAEVADLKAKLADLAPVS